MKTCLTCAGDMSHRSPQARYCDTKCREKARYERRPKDAESQNARTAKWRKKNAAYFRNYRKANSERISQYNAKWWADNPDARARYETNRRGLKVGNSDYIEVTEEDWKNILRQYRNRCAYCGCAENLTRDHVVPLSKGGRHAPSNIVPACGSCNSSKNGTFLSVWRYRKGGPQCQKL